MWKPQPYWLIADWLRFMEPARCKSCPWGQRRRPAAPVEDKFPSPIRNLFTPLQRQQSEDENGDSRGRYRSAQLWKPQPYGLAADYLGRMEPARGEICPSGQHRVTAAPGEDKVSSPGHKFLLISATPTTRGRKRRSLGSIPSRTVWKPQFHWLVAD